MAAVRATAGRGSSPRRPTASRRARDAARDSRADCEDERLRQQVAGPRQPHRKLRPAPLGCEPCGSDGDAAGRAERQRPASQHDRQRLDAERFAEVERKAWSGLTEHRADEQADHAAQAEEEEGCAKGSTAPDPQTRGDQRGAGRERDQHRMKDQAVLRYTEVEFGLEGRQAHEQAAHQADAPRRGHVLGPDTEARSGAGGGVGARPVGTCTQPFGDQNGLGYERQSGAPDQHQMGRTPERHVLAEQPVPQVIQGKRDQGERTAGRQQDATGGRVPTVCDPYGAPPRTLVRKDDREDSRREHAEQSHQDEVVRRVGERAGVAAVVDVQGYVPVHAEEGDVQGNRPQGRGQCRPPRQAGRPLGRGGGPPEDPHAAGTVSHRKAEQGGGGQDGAGGGDRDLRRLGASGRLCGGNGET